MNDPLKRAPGRSLRDLLAEPISIPLIRDLMEQAKRGAWWYAADVMTQSHLAQRLEIALEVLGEVTNALLLVEWSGEQGHPAALWCKVCRNDQAEGHKAGCEVAKALRKAMFR